MNFNVSQPTFGAHVKMNNQSTKPAMQEASKRIQNAIKNASNGELIATGEMASALSAGSLATKFPYVASAVASVLTLLAGVGLIDARATKKTIASKDSLIKQAGEKMLEQEATINEQNGLIKDLEDKNESLQAQNDQYVELLKQDKFARIFATGLWSRLWSK